MPQLTPDFPYNEQTLRNRLLPVKLPCVFEIACVEVIIQGSPQDSADLLPFLKSSVEPLLGSNTCAPPEVRKTPSMERMASLLPPLGAHTKRTGALQGWEWDLLDHAEGLGYRPPTRQKKGVRISKSLSERESHGGLDCKGFRQRGVSASPLAYSPQYPNIFQLPRTPSDLFRLPVAGAISLCWGSLRLPSFLSRLEGHRGNIYVIRCEVAMANTIAT